MDEAAGREYGYKFDDIGNRESAFENSVTNRYVSNQLNQYTDIDGFKPEYDDDGNQTLVKTSTGVWSVTYNGENRPVRWTQGDKVVTMSFDRMGRRVAKNNQRFVYDGYLCIKGIENTATIHYSLSPIHCFVWDPTEDVATLPLVWNRGGDVAYYAHDGNKNVSDVVASNGDIIAHYDYAPFGAIAAQSGALAATNPWRFSSEYAEDDTATVYYNYRHYDPVAGRWLQRDPIEEEGGLGLYGWCGNNTLWFDSRGLKKECKPLRDPISQSPDHPLGDKFIESVIDFLFGLGDGMKSYIYPNESSASERLRQHPKFSEAYEKFAAATCGTSESGDGEYKAKWWNFFFDVGSAFGRILPGGSDMLSNLGANDYGYEILGTFTFSYEIFTDTECCCKYLQITVRNTWSVDSLTRNPFTGEPISMLRNRVNLPPIEQEYYIDEAAPLEGNQ